MKRFILILLCLMMTLSLVACNSGGQDTNLQTIQGPEGQKGDTGPQGAKGKDGISPTISISSDGFWVINEEKTEYKALGTDGNTPTIEINADGYWVINGEITKYKAAGNSNTELPLIEIDTEGFWVIDGVRTDYNAQGISPTVTISSDGYWVIDGVKTSHSAQGTPGLTPVIEISSDGYWVINDKKTEYKASGNSNSEHSHTFGDWSPIFTSCTSVFKAKTCSVCGISEFKSEAVSNHSYNKTVIAATCVEKGYTLHSCKNCGYSYTDTYTDKLTHKYTDFCMLKSTCASDDVLQICSTCSTLKIDSRTPTGDHNYVNGICSVCGDEDAVKWDGTIASSFAGGTGTQNDPYLISTGSQLAFLAQEINNNSLEDDKYYKLTNSIDLANREWTPIGYYAISSSGSYDLNVGAFNGHFDGNNFLIKNYKLTALKAPRYAGLFGCVIGSVSNLRIHGCQINIASYYLDVGSLAGFTSNANITNCSSSNVNIFVTHSSVPNASVTKSIRAGGLIGELNTSSVQKCYSTGTIEGESSVVSMSAGGLVGFSYTADISNSYSITNVTVTAPTFTVGGIAAYQYSTSSSAVSKCYSVGNLKGVATSNPSSIAYSYIGGIVGCASAPTYCFSIGDIYGSFNQGMGVCYAGGIAGLTETPNCYAYSGQKVTCIGYRSSANTKYSSCSKSELNSESFYLNKVKFSSSIWDLSNLDFDNGKYPTLK